MTIYEFDRYINGQLMAEGVTIEKAKTLDAATAAAARIASKGQKGEAPVLVLRREPAAKAHLTALLRAEYERGKAETNALPADFTALVVEAAVEAEKAMRKFPQPNYVISKFAEEAGEVVKAAIHHAENRETRDAVVGEMRQVLAMMLRLWIEGDQVHGMKPLALLTQEGR